MQTNKPQSPFDSWREFTLKNLPEAKEFIQACHQVPADRFFVSPTVYDIWQ